MTARRLELGAAGVAPRAVHPMWSALRYTVAACLLVLVLVGCGWTAATGKATIILALAAVVGMLVLGAVRPGGLVGVLLLAAMDGIPFFDTARVIRSHLTGQDLAILILIAASIVWTVVGRRRNPNLLASALSWCGAGLLAWVLFIVMRTWAGGSAPFLASLKFGKDFAYFGALLVVLPRVRFDNRDIMAFVAVVAAGVTVFAVGQILTAEGIANPTYLVHAAGIARVGGVTRLYAGMNDLVLAALAVAIAALALGRLERWRWPVLLLTVLLAMSFVLELTRARWIALLTSLVAVSLWIAVQADRKVAVRLRRRLLTFLGVVVFLLVVASVIAPHTFSAGPILKRVVSIFTDVGSSNSQTSTFAYRQQLANEMLTVLGPHWFAGLGLIPPSAHYFAPFFDGSIRDPDVGVLNAVMTIGVVGAALIYLPLVVALFGCMRRMRKPAPVLYPWLNYGGQVWIVAAIVSSLTLVTLFSVSGLAMSAVILATLAQGTVSGSDTRTSGDSSDILELEALLDGPGGPGAFGNGLSSRPARTRPERVGPPSRG